MTTRRAGLSLTEVLVALFILGIGTIAILTLFPLGALNMAAALRDDRTSQAAQQADAYVRWYWQTNVVEAPAVNPEPFLTALADPTGSGTPRAQVGEPSFPLALDPMGAVVSPWPAGSGGNATQVAGQFGLATFPRRNLSPLPPGGGARVALSAPQALRTCSLLDGLGFDPSQGGRPLDPGTGQVDREYRYNWLWVVQNPDAARPTTATLSVVVFDRRTYLFVPQAAEQVFAPSPNGAAVGSYLVQFPSGTNLGVQRGGWILDATAGVTAYPSVRNAHFYRVVSLTDDGTNLNVELQTPLKSDTKASGQADIPAADANLRTFVALAGVAEVFERTDLTP